MEVKATLQELAERLDRYPVDRYPVQYATTRFHLGTAHLQAGDVTAADEALADAAQVFDQAGMAVEQAKALVMRGAALRTLARPEEALEAFARAARVFAEHERPTEEAAAQFNRGLVLAEAEETQSAAEAFTLAEQRFLAGGLRTRAGAAKRERGALLLTAGRLAEALPVLEDALELMGDADPAERGGTANALGLARLGAGDADGSVAAFTDALACHPRSVRPGEHAMVKANLAVAYQALGTTARARLAARQALGVPEAPPAVRGQAHALLAALPPATGSALFDVLQQEPPDRWQGVVRDEVLRWADATPDERWRAAQEWVSGQVEYAGDRTAVAESLLGVVLELPPPSYERVITALVEASADCAPQVEERFRSAVRSAMARFALPQWQRLAATFNSAAATAGRPQEWT